ncbi:ArsR/SmtB family transcription factor [uncultured Jatrophihabitans sp.]|uniref:ArsR/SmtB family transcription factor n=1 Tax=uncultured Jatrophihabitans sp. TaxID=1610747 RepID=UPI0035C96626
MPTAKRPVLDDAAVLQALGHPVRLDVLNHLMAEGPATASACARAVGDTPSNCSYHLRALARFGLVERDESGDGRERPWRAAITGFDIDDSAPGKAGDAAAGVLAAALQLDQRLARDYLADRDGVDPAWRAADAFSQYSLRITPRELTRLLADVDSLIRPFIAATREKAPAKAAQVHLGVQAFRRAPAT